MPWKDCLLFLPDVIKKVLIIQARGCWVTAALSCPPKANEIDTELSLLSVQDDFSQTRHHFYRFGVLFFSHLLATLSLTASDFSPEFPFPDSEGTVWGQRKKVRLTFNIPGWISGDKPWISAGLRSLGLELGRKAVCGWSWLCMQLGPNPISSLNLRLLLHRLIASSLRAARTTSHYIVVLGLS